MPTPRDAAVATPAPAGSTAGIRVLDEGAPILPRFDALPARQLAGMVVVSRRGRRLGRLKDVVVDLQNGVIAYALLARQAAGEAEPRLFAVPWGGLRFDAVPGCAVVDVEPETLESVPGIPAGEEATAWDDPARDRAHHTDRARAEGPRSPWPRPDRNGRFGH